MGSSYQIVVEVLVYFLWNLKLKLVREPNRSITVTGDEKNTSYVLVRDK